VRVTFESHRYWLSFDNRVIALVGGHEEESIGWAEECRCNVAILDERYVPVARATFDPATGTATYAAVTP
jgi:hypothetical protein